MNDTSNGELAIGEQQPEKQGTSTGFIILNIALLALCPFLSVLYENYAEHLAITTLMAGKWFIFWAVGIRLFGAGIKQASDPAFTAGNIFQFKDDKTFVIVRELGIANIALGVMGILSLINDSWRLLAAVTSMLFFGLVTAGHIFRSGKKRSGNELVALSYDALVFVALIGYLVANMSLEKTLVAGTI